MVELMSDKAEQVNPDPDSQRQPQQVVQLSIGSGSALDNFGSTSENDYGDVLAGDKTPQARHQRRMRRNNLSGLRASGSRASSTKPVLDPDSMEAQSVRRSTFDSPPPSPRDPSSSPITIDSLDTQPGVPPLPTTVTYNGPLRDIAVVIKSNHGPISVSCNFTGAESESELESESAITPVHLGGVNGSCQLEIISPRPHLHSYHATSKIHFDSILSDSSISANVGNIAITTDRKVSADIHLAGNSVDILTDAFESESESEAEAEAEAEAEETTPTTIKGKLLNVTNDPRSRADARSRGAGKIDHTGAASQALHAFGQHQSEPPRISASAKGGSITLNSLSWIGNIAAKYGVVLEEQEQQ